MLVPFVQFIDDAVSINHNRNQAPLSIVGLNKGCTPLALGEAGVWEISVLRAPGSYWEGPQSY
jgi:hypothetical protein